MDMTVILSSDSVLPTEKSVLGIQQYLTDHLVCLDGEAPFLTLDLLLSFS